MNKKLMVPYILIFLLYLIGFSVAGDSIGIEIRGQVATGNFEWTADNFAGFYYDIDDDLGTETLTTTITEGNKLEEPNGITYTTTAQKNDFDFEDWGYYNVIGFLGQRYFASYGTDYGYGTNREILEEANVTSLLEYGELVEILIDGYQEDVLDLSKSIDLKENYSLKLKVGTDNKGMLIELLKDKKTVDKKALLMPGTYTYSTKIGEASRMPIIVAHFQEPIFLEGKGYIKLDGLWQISENPIYVGRGTSFGLMTVTTIDPVSGLITMNNLDNTITLNKNNVISLMGDFNIKTSDQDVIDEANPLRYYIAKVVTEPGTYEVRGAIADSGFTWDPMNFAGFYYDIDDDLGTETLTTTITEGNKLEEPNGITYTTTAQKNDFEFEDWGYYNVIGFQAQQYFAGYLNDENVPDENEILFSESDDENSLSDEQLEAILVDSDDEMTIASGTPLKLEEGYVLSITSIDIDSNKVYLKLTKDGSAVDSKVISPSKGWATMADKTYYYKKDVGDSKDLVIIAAHFKNAFRGADQNLATIDGIWQISEVPTEVKADTEYDKMRIATVTSDTITMDNKDNTVTLSKNNEIDLMGDVKIKTADQDVIDDANPLRYYIFKSHEIVPAGGSL